MMEAKYYMNNGSVEGLIIFSTAVFTIFICNISIATHMKNRLIFIRGTVIYVLPFVLMFVGIPIGLIPAAYLAGLAFGFLALNELPVFLGHLVFICACVCLSLFVIWALTYPVLVFCNNHLRRRLTHAQKSD
jgi:hypothetical protein